MAGATGILGALRIIVDADTAKAQKALQTFGGKAAVAGAAVGAAMGGAAIAALRMGDAYDSAMDSIRVGTGATGAVLDGLEQSFKNVAGRVTEDISITSAVIAQLNTRTGETGKMLETVGESIIDVARLTATDYTTAVDGLTEVYGSWNIAAEDQVKTNDVLLRAYQTSGVALDKLTDDMTRNGAVLRTLGFSFDESVTLLGTLGAAGIDAAAVMGPLRKSIATLVKAGKDPKEAITGIFDAIKNAPDDVAAGQLALETFGAKGAAMATLIREGRLDIDKMFDTIASGSETVQGLSDDTRDAGDGFKELMNSVKTAVGPITSGLSGIADAMGNAIYLLPAIGGAIGRSVGMLAPKLRDGLKGVWAKVMSSGAVQAAVGAAGAVAGRIYAAAAAGAQALGGALSAAWTKTVGATAAGAAAGRLATSIGSVLTGALAAVFSVGGAVVVGIGAAIGLAIGSAIAGPEVAKAIAGMKEKVGKAVSTMVTDEDFDNARAVVQRGIDDVNGAMFGLGGVLDFGAKEALQQQLAEIDAAQAKVKAAVATPIAIPAPTIAGGGGVAGGLAKSIRRSFHVATKAAMDGFGSVKDALANPPKLRSKAMRLEGLKGQMTKVMAQLRRAVKAGDPYAIQYWETARGKVQRSQRRLKGTTVATMKDLKSEYAKTGTKVDGVWSGIKETTDTKSQAASQKAISEAEQTKAGIDAVNLRASGIGLMTELANGIYAGIPQVRGASYAAAAAAAGPLRAYSPPKEGPLSSIDKWGASLVDAWVAPIDASRGKVRGAANRLAGAFSPRPNLNALAMAGGVAGGGAGGAGGDHFHVGTLVADRKGLDMLDRRMAGRRRIKRRDRRRVDSPNGQGR